MVVVIGVFALTTHLTRTEREFRPPQFIEAMLSRYGRDAADAYESGGSDALEAYLRRVEHETSIRMHLFDADGRELTGRRCVRNCKGNRRSNGSDG